MFSKSKRGKDPSGFRFRKWQAMSRCRRRAIGSLGLTILLSMLGGACGIALPVTGLGTANLTPTPLIAGATSSIADIVPAASTSTLAPFRFELPSPGAAPVSGWRPPLYPVPWAVSPYDHFYFARPIAADQVNWPLADYRYGAIFDPPFIHTGVDIDAPYGTPILAAGPGTIVWSNWGLLLEAPGDRRDPYGQAVVIRMDFGFKDQQLYTVYAHMSKLIAVAGQRVNTGDVIGLVGATGHVTGPHVHFEVRLGQNSFFNTYNPELWMSPPEGWGVLVGRISDTGNNTLQQVEVLVSNTATQDNRLIKTYGSGPVNPDPYYNENLVLSDLPAGLYKIAFYYKGETSKVQQVQDWMNIYAGQVTYFTFKGKQGFSIAPPPAPKLTFPPTTAP